MDAGRHCRSDKSDGTIRIGLAVGGTTTDVDLLQTRFPRESTVAIDLDGVRTNFRIPDVVYVGVGGRGVIPADGFKVTVGPDSVGHDLNRKFLVFDGEALTFTDVAAAGFASFGNRDRVSELEVTNFAKSGSPTCAASQHSDQGERQWYMSRISAARSQMPC